MSIPKDKKCKIHAGVSDLHCQFHYYAAGLKMSVSKKIQVCNFYSLRLIVLKVMVDLFVPSDSLPVSNSIGIWLNCGQVSAPSFKLIALQHFVLSSGNQISVMTVKDTRCMATSLKLWPHENLGHDPKSRQ